MDAVSSFEDCFSAAVSSVTPVASISANTYINGISIVVKRDSNPSFFSSGAKRFHS